MKTASFLAAALLAAAPLVSAEKIPETSGAALTKLQEVVNGNHRVIERKARDRYRHPVETLSFFGIQPEMTVVELWPFGGWYTEILAPYLKDKGKLYAAAMDPDSDNPGDKKYNADLKAMFAARPELFSKVEQTVLARGKYQVAPDGSADLVLTFRNIHNWQGMEKEVFAAAYRALKPGGVLGVTEHRHDDPNFQPGKRGEAYVGEEWAKQLIESVGFKFAGSSDVNRNPKDTKDYPRGVWTLPPNYAMGDVDREKYTAIGESDRFTIRFVKPK